MSVQQHVGGILISGKSNGDAIHLMHSFAQYVESLGLDSYVESVCDEGKRSVRFWLREEMQRDLLPEWDTLGFGKRLQLDTTTILEWVELEVLFAMLASPVILAYPNVEELLASIRIRKNIVAAAHRTGLSFHTDKIERPLDCWTYSEDSGFTILPGRSLIDALIKATQPAVSGEQYSFSCYRATEYVILLGIAQELARSNPDMLLRLQRQWELKAVQSGRFHDTFMYEYGAMSEPLPQRFYVPGDRLWFRNPDQ